MINNQIGYFKITPERRKWYTNRGRDVSRHIIIGEKKLLCHIVRFDKTAPKEFVIIKDGLNNIEAYDLLKKMKFACKSCLKILDEQLFEQTLFEAGVDIEIKKRN